MKKIEVFVCSDNSWHETEEKAKAYEEKLSIESKVDKYMESDFYPYKNHKTPYFAIVSKCIVAWELYKESQK